MLTVQLFLGAVVFFCTRRDQPLSIGQDEPEGYAGNQSIRDKCKGNRGMLWSVRFLSNFAPADFWSLLPCKILCGHETDQYDVM